MIYIVNTFFILLLISSLIHYFGIFWSKLFVMLLATSFTTRNDYISDSNALVLLFALPRCSTCRRLRRGSRRCARAWVVWLSLSPITLSLFHSVAHVRFLCLARLSHSIFRTPSHAPTLSLSHWLALSLPLILSLSHSIPPTPSHSLSHLLIASLPSTHTLSNTLSLPLTLSLSHSRTLSLPLTLSLSHSHSLTASNTLTPSLLFHSL